MKRLKWIDNGSRAFGCAGCNWTYPVEEFATELSEFDLRQDFTDHDCNDPRFRVGENGKGTRPDSDLATSSANTTQLLANLCGVRGAVLAAIEALPGAAVAEQDLVAIKKELDSLRSLVWLRVNAGRK